MNDTFTTALYLFSSLLQADATIIGFGAIFVIYKLQALDSSYQNALTLCQSAGQGDVGDIAKLIVITDDPNKKETLLQRHEGQLYYSQLRLLITIPLQKNKVKRIVKWPLFFTVIHISLSVICLWLTPNINSVGAGCTLASISWSIIVFGSPPSRVGEKKVHPTFMWVTRSPTIPIGMPRKLPTTKQ